MQIRANCGLVPERMVEHDQATRVRVEFGQQLLQHALVRLARESRAISAMAAVTVCEGKLWTPTWKFVFWNGVVHSTEIGTVSARSSSCSCSGASIESWSEVETIGARQRSFCICRISTSRAWRGVSGGVHQMRPRSLSSVLPP